MSPIRALLVVSLLSACGDSSGAPAAGAPRRALEYPVETAPVAAARVEYAVDAVGSVEAFEKVQVTARVAGVVERVLFKEGDLVEVGQVLAEIEIQRYQVAQQLAQAALDRAAAGRADAQASLTRRERAVQANPGLISGEEIESFRTRLLTANADVAGARAALDVAKLNLRDAHVRAPLAGVIETRTVQTGQYLQPGGVLASLVRRDPLLLRFNVPEGDAQRLHTGMGARLVVRGGGKKHDARITAVAAAADPNTRMVMVTAIIEHPADLELRPGAFAQVTVPIGEPANRPVVPQAAVRPSERGFLAYVVVDGTARERVLELGMRTPDGQVEVKKGLVPGENLVVRGAEALREGAKVKIAPAGTVPPPNPTWDAGVAAP